MKPTTPGVFVVRPDGYLSFASDKLDSDELVSHPSSTFATSVSTTARPDLR